MTASPSRRADVICIIGMHRSGTSLAARMVNLLGVDLGPGPRVLTSGDDNPKGYWEYRPFVDINDEILARFGGQWDRPPVFPHSWTSDPRLDDLKARARQLIAEDFSIAPRWGWKDPRSCLTLPFWQDVIGPMRYIVCIRNPRAAMASLTRRDGRSSESAGALWLTHMQETLAATSGHPRMLVFYEDILEDWLRELTRLAAFIGNAAWADDPQVREAAGEFLDRELCHHRFSIDDLAQDQSVSFPATALYVALRGATSAEDLSLERFGARALAEWHHTNAVAAERDTLARAHHKVNEQLEEIHTSAAYKAITLGRGLIVTLLPDGSRRRRAFHAALARLTHTLA